MRTNVTFQHPAEFVPVSEEDRVLAIRGAQWFVSLLRRVPDLQIDDKLCQEDWGVVIVVRRNQRQFRIQLGMWPEGEHSWFAHVHHGVYSWLQRLSSSGKTELKHLVSDIHATLAGEAAVSAITWYELGEMGKPLSHGFPSPDKD